MMSRVLKDKFLGLGRDEDGVAMVVTLAVFMFIYVVCMGVYAIGAAVKDKIHLQNACDAAAYSAAVVQADTLSRIATINRAMSWTYVQMTRRQMDYITYKWLDHVRWHYNYDAKEAWKWYQNGKCRCGRPYSWCEISKLTLHVCDADNQDLVFNVTEKQIDDCNVSFLGGLRGSSGSFYGGGTGWDESRLKSQIRADKSTISNMNNRVVELLEDLPGRVDGIVCDVLNANLPTNILPSCAFMVRQSSPMYLRHMEPTAESRFIGFSGHDTDILQTFSAGIDKWFVLDKNEDSYGFQREYDRSSPILRATWQWSAAYADCSGPGSVHGPTYIKDLCDHNCERDSCYGLDPHRAVCYGDNSTCYEDGDKEGEFYIGERAEPYEVTADYFGADGSISVGLARRNSNPWASIIGNGAFRLDGIFAAFNHYANCDWTWCFASAKAGYKFLGEREEDARYRIDWVVDNQSWNLCQSDWDAVMIPVRKADTFAQNGAWDSGVSNIEDWIQQGKWRDFSGAEVSVNPVMIAGGKTDAWAQMESGDDYVDDMGGLVWAELPDSVQRRDNYIHDADVQWGVSRQGGSLRWADIADRMIH